MFLLCQILATTLKIRHNPFIINVLINSPSHVPFSRLAYRDKQTDSIVDHQLIANRRGTSGRTEMD